MRTRALVASACSIALLATAAAAVAAWPTTSSSEPETVAAQQKPAWAPCPDNAALDCATLWVPVDWTNPHGPRTALNLTRAPATDPAHKLGVLIAPPPVNLTALSTTLRRRFDLVGYTRRALDTGAAGAARCVVPSDVTYYPADQQQFDQLRAANRAADLACAKVYGANWQHLDSGTEARDVDAVRAALGQDTISLLNTSTGDLAAEVYAELFPHRLRALVLDGSPDHSLTGAAGYLAGEAGAMDATFTAFADWCGRTPDCAFHAFDLRAFYPTLLDRTEQGKVKDLRGNPFDLATLSAGVQYRLSAPPLGWIDVADHLMDFYERMGPIANPNATQNGGTPAAQPGPATAPSTADAPSGMLDDGSAAGLCEDWNLAIDSFAGLQSARQAMAAAAPLARINGLQWLAAMRCVGWPFPVADPPHPLRVPAGVPVLVAYGAADPDQPAAWGEAVASQIPGAARLLYQGPGTSTYFASPCARDAIDAFLITRTASATTTCPAIWP